MDDKNLDPEISDYPQTDFQQNASQDRAQIPEFSGYFDINALIEVPPIHSVEEIQIRGYPLVLFALMPVTGQAKIG